MELPALQLALSSSIPLELFSSRESTASLIGQGRLIKVSHITSYDRRQSCLHNIYDSPDIPKP